MKPLSPAKKAFATIKKQSVSSLKKRVWTVVSLYVRQRDADENGIVSCCTCKIRKHWKQVDAGHFIDGRNNANLFDVRGIHAQCKPCNGNFKQVRENVKENYYNFMLKRYGAKVIRELREQNKTTKQFTVSELQALYDHYKLLTTPN